mmetsp:Transcript_42031/g.42622  ORF Transcript_42031/g.42622 Transcript_42031/m.42622 type:complete len:141 (+) Transcript_42031:160-582(+)
MRPLLLIVKYNTTTLQINSNNTMLKPLWQLEVPTLCHNPKMGHISSSTLQLSSFSDRITLFNPFSSHYHTHISLSLYTSYLAHFFFGSALESSLLVLFMPSSSSGFSSTETESFVTRTGVKTFDLLYPTFSSLCSTDLRD